MLHGVLERCFCKTLVKVLCGCFCIRRYSRFSWTCVCPVGLGVGCRLRGVYMLTRGMFAGEVSRYVEFPFAEGYGMLAAFRL